MREVFITVPIEYIHTPANLILSEDRLGEAKLLLEGPASQLDSLMPSQVRLKVDLAAMAAGRQLVNLTDEDVELPKKINVLEIIPANLTLELSNLTLSQLKVKPQFIGELKEGFNIDHVEISPDMVEVVVPEGKKEDRSELLTTPIYLQGIESSTTVFCKIVAPYGYQPKEKRWPDVSVTISIIPKKK